MSSLASSAAVLAEAEAVAELAATQVANEALITAAATVTACIRANERALALVARHQGESRQVLAGMLLMQAAVTAQMLVEVAQKAADQVLAQARGVALLVSQHEQALDARELRETATT